MAGFINSLTPNKPTNAGLAYVAPTVADKIIGMFENFKKQKAADDRFSYKKEQDLAKWKQETLDLDYNGLSSAQIESSTNAINSIMQKADSREASTGIPSNIDYSINNSIFQVKSTMRQMQATNNEIKAINEGANPDGDYWYLDAGKTSQRLMEMQKLSDAAKFNKLAGKEYDANALSIDTKSITDDVANYDSGAISNDYWSKNDDATSQVYINIGEGKLERNQLVDFEMSSMIELDPNNNYKPILDPSTGFPIVKDTVPDDVVNDIRLNNKRYDESLDYRVAKLAEQGDTKPDGTPYNKKDLIRDDYMKAGGSKTEIKNINSLYEKPSKPTGADKKQKEVLSYVQSGINAAENGTPNDINLWLSGVSKGANGINYTYKDNEVTATYNKAYFATQGIDITDPNFKIEQMFGANAKKLSNGSVEVKMPFSKNNYQSTMMNILNSSKHIDEGTREGALELFKKSGLSTQNKIPGF